jgi:hypothetical protein
MPTAWVNGSDGRIAGGWHTLKAAETSWVAYATGHVLSMFTAPGADGIFAAYGQSTADVFLGGLRQGFPGGGVQSKGIVGFVTDALTRAAAKASTPAGLTTLAGTAGEVSSEALAKSIGLAKLGRRYSDICRLIGFLRR